MFVLDAIRTLTPDEVSIRVSATNMWSDAAVAFRRYASHALDPAVYAAVLDALGAPACEADLRIPLLRGRTVVADAVLDRLEADTETRNYMFVDETAVLADISGATTVDDARRPPRFKYDPSGDAMTWAVQAGNAGAVRRLLALGYVLGTQKRHTAFVELAAVYVSDLAFIAEMLSAGFRVAAPPHALRTIILQKQENVDWALSAGIPAQALATPEVTSVAVFARIMRSLGIAGREAFANAVLQTPRSVGFFKAAARYGVRPRTLVNARTVYDAIRAADLRVLDFMVSEYRENLAELVFGGRRLADIAASDEDPLRHIVRGGDLPLVVCGNKIVGLLRRIAL